MDNSDKKIIYTKATVVNGQLKTQILDLKNYSQVDVIILVDNNNREERLQLQEEVLNAGYTPEKIVDVVRQVRQEILREKEGLVNCRVGN
jgi:NCAIR mutase (PurE)-related protein